MTTKSTYRILRTKQALEAYLRGASTPIFFDTETTGLSIDSLLLGISLYDNISSPVFIPTNYFFDGMSLEEIRSVWNTYASKFKGIAHNAKYDYTVFHFNGLLQPTLEADTMLMVHCYDPNLEKQLEKCVSRDLKISKKTFEEVIGKKWDKIDWVKDIKDGSITLQQLAEYACEDVYYTARIYDYYLAKLEKEKLLKVHNEIELPLVYVLADMYQTGVKTDVVILHSMGKQIDEYQKQLTQDIYKEAGAVFNINSGKQKAEILFDKLGLPTIKATKTGAASTDSDVMQQLANEGYQIAQHLLEYSELQKLSSGYINSIPDLVDADGRLRCNFNSAGTKTGRFSSSNPNLQNQPNNDRFPIRKSFIPDEGYEFICLDYSQIELRVMAHVSQDKRFMSAFHNGEDIHGVVAKDLNITRKQAKIVNFGILYGMGPEKLSNSLDISIKEAKSVVRGYEATYLGYYVWKQQVEKIAERSQYVKTIFGRIRRLPHVTKDKGMYFSALRQAVNTVIQGSAADIIKRAMIALHARYKTDFPGSRILLQVHDELVIEATKGQITQCYDATKEIMEKTTLLSVPLEVDGKIIQNWAQMKDDNAPSLYNNYLNQKTETPIWLM